MRKMEASCQGELTGDPNDKYPFRRKQQRTVSGESGIPGCGGRSVPQLKAIFGLGEAAYGMYGRVKGKKRYKNVDMPAICVEIAKKLKGRKYK